MTLLQSVMQKIIGQADTVEVAHVVDSHKAVEKLSAITTLYELLQDRALVSVTSQRTGRQYQSLILSIDMETQTFQLDELFPISAVTSLSKTKHQPGDRYTLHYRQQGNILTFTTTLITTLPSSGAQYYLLTVPDLIEHTQRRQSKRVVLSRQQPLSIKITAANRNTFFATAHNLSGSGVRIAIGGNMVDQFAIGSRVNRCEITFSNDFKIRCQGLVRAMTFNRSPYRHTEISLEFDQLTEQEKNQLNQLIDAYHHTREAA